jgi:hypothetical protein
VVAKSEAMDIHHRENNSDICKLVWDVIAVCNSVPYVAAGKGNKSDWTESNELPGCQ